MTWTDQEWSDVLNLFRDDSNAQYLPEEVAKKLKIDFETVNEILLDLSNRPVLKYDPANRKYHFLPDFTKKRVEKLVKG